jgi:hypothetical protein
MRSRLPVADQDTRYMFVDERLLVVPVAWASGGPLRPMALRTRHAFPGALGTEHVPVLPRPAALEQLAPRMLETVGDDG